MNVITDKKSALSIQLEQISEKTKCNKAPPVSFFVRRYPEGKSKCKDHNEDVSFVCNTCNVVVCSSCVTGSHSGHAFSKLLDSITQLKETNTTDLRSKVQTVTTNMKQIEEGMKAFDVKVEGIVKAITEEGTKIKTMVDTCVAEMIISVRDQSKTEKDKLTKIIADTQMDLKVGSKLDKKTYDLDKIRNHGELLQSLQKLTDDVAKLTVKPLPEFPNIHYTAKSTTDNNIKQLFGIFKLSSDARFYEPDVKPKEKVVHPYKCGMWGNEQQMSACSNSDLNG
ncbi:unnamed protein product [Mytilus edulis]|uniref:B box-type domain-containing protein n=1 Tax=Mytilus edulis TaxID=6550 RepID=A0A8S3Q047_MYTED|nr:unnamed protein product [Mytilus edulis]